MKMRSRMLKTSALFTGLLILIIAFAACDDPPIPKPRAYFRIDLPEKEYHRFEGPCPYSFEIPKYSGIQLAEGRNDSCQINLVFPELFVKVYFTYLPVERDVTSYMNDAYQMAYSHELKASAIDREKLELPDKKVYAMVYDLKGDVATSLQFYATDSSNHFLRASLYFNSSPNADSIAPVLSFIREDMIHLINTLEWKE